MQCVFLICTHAASSQIPLAKKLFTCGVFGVSSDEYLNNAIINRKEWAAKGEAMVKQYIANAEKTYGKSDSS